MTERMREEREREDVPARVPPLRLCLVRQSASPILCASPRLNQPRGTSSQLDTKLLSNLTMLYSVLRAHRQLRKLKR